MTSHKTYSNKLHQATRTRFRSAMGKIKSSNAPNHNNSVSLLFLFIFFSMFFVLIHDYTLCFTDSLYCIFSYCKFSYYNYMSIWPYYIVIHFRSAVGQCLDQPWETQSYKTFSAFWQLIFKTTQYCYKLCCSLSPLPGIPETWTLMWKLRSSWHFKNSFIYLDGIVYLISETYAFHVCVVYIAFQGLLPVHCY